MKTPIYEEHLKEGGHMVDFHGWDMPLYYDGILKEHMYVRKNAGIFDVSHMGDVLVEGPDVIDFLNYVLPTDISVLKDGECTYTAFLDQDGLIIDDTIVYRISEHKFFFVPNASTTKQVFSWVSGLKQDFDVELTDHSNELACIAVQGPRTKEIASNLNLNFPEPFKFSYIQADHLNPITSANDGIISGTGYTGEIGFELIVPREESTKWWNIFLKEVKAIDGGACGLGARDTLRMEKGMLLSGTDFNHDRDPYECSISFIVTNSNEFVGRNSLLKRKETDKERFRGFVLESKLIPRHGNVIKLDETEVGHITSGTSSPILEKSIALGFIDKSHFKSGTKVKVDIRSRMVEATVSRPKIVP